MANYPDEGDIITLTVRIATTPFLPRPQVGFQNVPTGIASSYIFSLKPGDKVMMSGPYGDFHPNFTSGKEMIWIGGGAGMAPLRAQIMHMTKTLHTTDRELHFFYGARALGEAFFLEDFWELEKEFPNFHFHLSLDRKDPVADAQGVKEFRSVHGIPLQILADGKAFDLESLMALIFNGETAGGFHLAPRSSIKDGMFDCLLLQRRNMLFSVVSMLRHLLGGRPSQVKHFRARTLDITSPINEPTDVDGQKGADFPLHIECLHNELRVVCPLSEAPRRGRLAYFKNLISKLAWWRTR
jgi:hypothetical protein